MRKIPSTGQFRWLRHSRVHPPRLPVSKKIGVSYIPNPSLLVLLLVVVLIFLLVSCCCLCLHRLCCRVANAADDAVDTNALQPLPSSLPPQSPPSSPTSLPSPEPSPPSSPLPSRLVVTITTWWWRWWWRWWWGGWWQGQWRWRRWWWQQCQGVGGSAHVRRWWRGIGRTVTLHSACVAWLGLRCLAIFAWLASRSSH
jgi:hypothetical protein